ncbi:RCC1 domain-containing protein [Nannocystaceae bacterium ST9]
MIDGIARAAVVLIVPLFSCQRLGDERDSITAIFGEDQVMCARSKSGQVKCWGDNYRLEYYPIDEFGWRVGDDEALADLPALDIGGTLSEFDLIPSSKACMVLEGSLLKCWGKSGDYLLLLPKSQAVSFSASENIFIDGLSDVSMGTWHACMLVEGDVHCWGDNSFNVLGMSGPPVAFDDVRNRAAAGETPVDIGEPTIDVAVGYEHSCALTEKGGVHCWGNFINTGYADPSLGSIIGDDETPQMAGPLPFATAVRGLNSLGTNTCGLLATGGIVCWGSGSTVVDAEEVHVDSPFVGMSMGSGATCGVTMNGELHCWGQNTNGALGTGNSASVPASAPAHIEPGEPIAEVVLSATTTCVRSTTGRVKCWGSHLAHGLQTEEDLGDDELVADIPWLEF